MGHDVSGVTFTSWHPIEGCTCRTLFPLNGLPPMKATWALTSLVFLLLSGCDMGSDMNENDTRAPTASGATQDNDCGCKDIEATLYTTADFETFTAQGTIVGDLDGTISFTGDANSLSQISSETFPPVNPATFSFTSEVDFITNKGTITTRGVGLAEIGPSGSGTELHQILGGTGRYENATGTFYLRVKADATGANFVEELTGRICVVKKGCD